MTPVRFLTARSTVIGLFGAISAALLLASLLPQRASLADRAPEWLGRLPEGVARLCLLLSLDNVVGSPWFACLVAVFWFSLLLSTVSQYGATKALAARLPAPELPAGTVRVELAPVELERLVRSAGYAPAGSAPGVTRYLRNRIGYWGSFLLHLGLVVAVVFSLVYVLTQHRVMLQLSGEEIVRLSHETVQERTGVLPLSRELPFSVVLKSLKPEFYANDKLSSLSSELYFTDKAGGDPRRVEVALSDKGHFGPFLVYQVNAFGRSFDLELQGPGELLRHRFFLPYPDRRDAAGYGETALGNGMLLKAKFYADRDKAGMRLNQPSLTLRLYRGPELVQQATLEEGALAQLGPYQVRLLQSQWWTNILLDGSRGTAGIFAGFAIILLGVLSSYCLVPREIIVRNHDGALHLQQVVRRFPDFYREEFDELVQKAVDQADRTKEP